MVKVLLAVQITVAAELVALRTGAAEVAPVEVMVTPEPAEKVTDPAAMRWTLTIWPVVKTEGGTVIVIAPELEAVTRFPTSLEAKVYEVPV